MAETLACPLCQLEPAESFCICSNFPRFCHSCREIHERKQGFHFALPLACAEYITPRNQQQYMTWLICLKNSQERLRENMQHIGQCRRDIEALHLSNQENEERASALGYLKELETIFNEKIEETIEITTTNAYNWMYQPNTYIVNLVWAHSRKMTSEPINVFSYAVFPIDESYGAGQFAYTFEGCLSETEQFYRENTGMRIWRERNDAQTQMEAARRREQDFLRDLQQRLCPPPGYSPCIRGLSSNFSLIKANLGREGSAQAQMEAARRREQELPGDWRQQVGPPPSPFSKQYPADSSSSFASEEEREQYLYSRY